MEDSSELPEPADSLQIGVWNGVAFRHTSPGRDPLSGDGAKLFGGRWNPPGIATIYLAFPREACLAEFERMAESQPGGSSAFLPRSLHQVDVSGLRVLDLRSEPALRSAGLSQSDVKSADWGPCQRVGQAAVALQMQGVLIASASGVGFVLAVFQEHIQPGQLQVVNTVVFDSV